MRQKFTSKERDIETGLDYFLARYYSSTQGRFTSPDEFSGGPDEVYDFAENASENPTFYAELDVPQSLNKYQYTYNNPVNMTDDDGHCPPCGGLRNKQIYDKIKENPSAALDIVQGVITAVGFVPVVGDGADLVNGGISLARGNLGDAAADFTGAVNGTTKCNNCGTETVPGQKAKKGVPKPSNETQVDHVKPKSRGGEGRSPNGQVLCRKCNQQKGNKEPQ